MSGVAQGQEPETMESELDQRLAAAPGPIRMLLHTTTFWVGLALAILIAGFGFLSEDFLFFKPDNLTDMAVNSVVAVLLACGAAYMLGAGLLDLSIGANLVLSSVVGAKVMTAVAGSPEEVANGVYPHLGAGIVAGILAAIAVGATFGLVNGLLVTRLRIHAFIVTLATTGIGTGISLVMTDGVNVPYVPREVQTEFGVNKLFDIIPLPVLLAAVIVAVLWVILNKTRFGVHTLAVGSSPEAAIRANVKVDRQIILLFILMGVLAGIAALVDISRFGTTNVQGHHQTDPLAAIAAAVIGGTSLFGGRASIGGSVLGALIPVVLATGLVILDVVSYYQLIVVGVILILAVFLDQIRRRRFL